MRSEPGGAVGVGRVAAAFRRGGNGGGRSGPGRRGRSAAWGRRAPWRNGAPRPAAHEEGPPRRSREAGKRGWFVGGPGEACLEHTPAPARGEARSIETRAMDGAHLGQVDQPPQLHSGREDARRRGAARVVRAGEVGLRRLRRSGTRCRRPDQTTAPGQPVQAAGSWSEDTRIGSGRAGPAAGAPIPHAGRGGDQEA